MNTILYFFHLERVKMTTHIPWHLWDLLKRSNCVTKVTNTRKNQLNQFPNVDDVNYDNQLNEIGKTKHKNLWKNLYFRFNVWNICKVNGSPVETIPKKNEGKRDIERDKENCNSWINIYNYSSFWLLLLLLLWLFNREKERERAIECGIWP